MEFNVKKLKLRLFTDHCDYVNVKVQAVGETFSDLLEDLARTCPRISKVLESIPEFKKECKRLEKRNRRSSYLEILGEVGANMESLSDMIRHIKREYGKYENSLKLYLRQG